MFGFFQPSMAAKAAEANAQILSEALAAEAQHMADKKKKETAKKKKATKEDKKEVELIVPTEKMMAAWRKEIEEEMKNTELERVAAARSIENYESADRAWITSWRNDRTKYLKAKEAARRKRGIVSHSAVRRLTRELKIVTSDPSWGVAAKPVDDDLLWWHCNVAAPGGLTGKGILHLELKFPPQYPALPPQVKILGADVEHPNIFGSYICLDMLEKGEFATAEHALKPYTGWSSAYGVQAILRQLQSFFYSGADSGDTKGRIRIKPWTGHPTWEYQLEWDECNTWKDWAWDPFSFCGHTHASPGSCPVYKWCSSKGRLTRKWIKMHDADMARMENLWQAHKDDEDDSVWHSVHNPVFARKLTPRKVFFIKVNFAVGLETNKGLYHSVLEYNSAPTYEWRPFVVVSFADQEEETRKCNMHLVNNNHPNAKSYLAKVAGPTTPNWMSEHRFDYKPYNASDNVVFRVYDESPSGRVLLGMGKYPLKRILDAKSGKDELKLTLEDTDKRKHKKTMATLFFSFNVPEPKDKPTYEYQLKPRGVDGDFYQRSGLTGSVRRVRRRNGYCCEVCDHTPLAPSPELPCAVDCDDAPTFALEAFYASMKEAAGSNPQALKAIERTMASLKEEKKERSESKLTDLPQDTVMMIMEYLPRNRERRYMAQVYPPWEGLYLSAQFWEAQHLRCFSTGAAPHEDLLGIGVTAGEAMHGRPVFTCQFDAMSYTAYSEGVRIGVWKEPLTHWIPLYIDKHHATKSMPRLFPMLSKLSVGVRSSTSAWTVCGADIDGKGKGFLKKVKAPGHVFRSTGWAGLRGGTFGASGCHYFQVRIGSFQEIPGFKIAGRLAAHGVIKIGWVTMTGDVNLGTDKYGFCLSSNGHKVHDAVREDYTDSLLPGDIVGTSWNADQRTISYFVNGKPLGVAYNVPRNGNYPGLIPAVALSHATIEVDIEGGFNPPCRCDTETLGAHERTVTKNIASCLTVLPQLMNHMVVDVMKGSLHASVKALQGYCAIHRLLLHCCETVPGMQDAADEQIRKFVERPAERHKVMCPDLGILLCLLTISKRYWWEDIRNPFMTELFARHVRWSLKKSKRFAAGTMLPRMAKDNEMADEAFFANETSCKLVMFQVFFCNLVKPQKGDDVPDGDFFAPVKSDYDSRMGFPTKYMIDALVDQMTNVTTSLAKGWNGFLTNIGGQSRTTADIAKRIRDAVARSELSGYHADVSFPDKPYAVKLMRMPPRPRLKPGEKPKPKRAPRREKLEEDSYGNQDDGFDKYD